MKKTLSRFVPALAAASFALAGSLAVATVVEAQTPPAPSGRPTPPDGWMGHGDRAPRGGPGMHGMRDIEGLKASLQLNASQSAAWDKAVAQMKPPAHSGEQMKADHDRMMAALADPNFNPRTLAADMDRAETERRARMSTIRDAWFAVYDTLNPAQRGQVREFLRERMSHRGGMHREGMHEGMHPEGMQHEGGMRAHDGERGGMTPGRPAPDAATPTR